MPSQFDLVVVLLLVAAMVPDAPSSLFGVGLLEETTFGNGDGGRGLLLLFVCDLQRVVLTGSSSGPCVAFFGSHEALTGPANG